MTVISLMLTFVYLSIWIRQRRLAVYLTFALCSLSAAAIAIFELLMMRAATPERWALLDRWVHVPTTALRVGLVLFVALQFPLSRRGWIAPLLALLLGALSVNFLTGVNVDFLDVTALRTIPVWLAAPVSVPVGEPNPWMLLGKVNAVLIIAFLIDTIVVVRKRGDADERRRVIPVCGSIIVFLLVAGVWRVLVTQGLITAPLLVAPPFLGISLVMAYLIGSDILRASEMSMNLKTAEARLLENEQQVDLASTVAGLGLWRWSNSDAEPWLSPSARFMIGLASTASLEDWTHVFEYVWHEDRERVRASIEAALRGDGNIRVEFRIAGSGTDLRSLTALGKILFKQDHSPVHSYGVLVDVTERSKAEERFRLLFDAMPTAVLLVDDRGSIAFANTQAESMFGYRDRLIGMTVESLIPPRYRNGHADMRRLFAGSRAARAMGAGLELSAQRSDGSEIVVEIGLTPIQIGQDHFTVTSVADIGERKRLEREMATQRDELAHLSRTASLSALSGSLAHELNQPLTAILSNAQAGARFLAHQPPDLEEVGISFTNVVDNAKRAGDVIRKLRSMLRNDRTEFIRLDINDVVREVLEILRSDLIDRRVDVVLQLADGLPPIKGDRVQLQQVLLNLMMNAADAMGSVAGERTLGLRTLFAEQEIEVQVADTGPGIPEPDLARIFAPFVTGKKGGMGLGLSVCTMLVQAHAGRLWATNNSGRGATLHFRVSPYADDARQ